MQSLRSDRLAVWRRVGAVAVTAVLSLFLAACNNSGPSDSVIEPAGGTVSAPVATLPLQVQQSPSDDKKIIVRDVGFQIIERDDARWMKVIWAAELENTSQTDLLAYAGFDLTWRNAEEIVDVYRWHGSSQQQVYDILPGRTAVIGGATSVIATADSLEVTIQDDRWYPMRDLEAHGLSVGIEVTGAAIEIDNRVRVQTGLHSSYTGFYQTRPGQLRLLIVLRDKTGELLGAVEAAQLQELPSGERNQYGSIELSWWPDEADTGTSEVVVTKVCCTWVGQGLKAQTVAEDVD